MKILVVDDMPLMRHVLINMLRRLDYNDITEATDGAQAFDLLEKQTFDLVITDLHMPKMDGRCLLNHIRETPTLANLPVLMVTCEDSKQTVNEMITARVNGFIVKPFCLNTLQKQLSRIVKPD
jgi:two-component system chemotaxis response regulator CheY